VLSAEGREESGQSAVGSGQLANFLVLRKKVLSENEEAVGSRQLAVCKKSAEC